MDKVEKLPLDHATLLAECLQGAERAFSRIKCDILSGVRHSNLVMPKPQCPAGCTVCDFRCAAAFVAMDDLRGKIMAEGSMIHDGKIYAAPDVMQ